ncbi:MAG: flavodoxin family protein [Desulfobacteraceae bacterium]|nr:flavodoxin family protein [Desulfobacteraceae bacterium]
MKVVAFSGSARKDGNTAILVREIFKELVQHGLETELVQLASIEIKACLACYRCFENKDQHCSVEDDELNQFIDKMLAAEGIILASPTYIGDVTSIMKALIDRAGMVSRANDNMLRRKVGAAVAVASWGGAIHTFDSLNHFFLIGEMIVVGSSNWNLGFGREKGQVLQDQKSLETMRTLGRNMAWLLNNIHTEKASR